MKLKNFYFATLLLSFLIFSCSEDEEPTPDTLVVNAGPDQTVDVGELVTLAGTATDASGNALSFSWVISTKPSGSTASLSGSTGQSPTFTPDVEGEYMVSLSVNNTVTTKTDEVKVTAEGVPLKTIELSGTITEDSILVDIFSDDTPDYLVVGALRVDGSATLTVKPGVIIEFSDNLGLSIESGASLIAKGETDNPILFTGKEKTKGYWKGIEILSNSASNELDYLTIAYGGSSGFDGANLKSNLMVDDDGRVKVTNSTFSNGGGYGIYTRDLESELVDFANNKMTGNAAPVMTRINHYHYFDVASDYTGNTDDFIDSYWSNQDVDGDLTWNAVNVPYRLAGNIEQIVGDVTVSPGVEIIAQPKSGIEVTPSGSFNAVGTSTDPIIIKGEEDVTGYWKGLSFESNNASNELTYVQISNGGQEGFDGANLKTNIMVDLAGRVKITNTTSSKSGGYGLYTRKLESALPDFADNTFTGNVAPVMTRLNHYHYFDSNSDFTGNDNDYIDSYWSNADVEGTLTWQALNVPYRMAANIEEIAADITINEGAEFMGQPNGGFEVITGGSMTANGTADKPVKFYGEQDVTGYWKGLRFLSNTANNKLTNIEVANGGEEGFDGANRKANIEVGPGAKLEISTGTISKSGGYGIRIQSGGVLTSSGLTFTDNISDDTLED